MTPPAGLVPCPTTGRASAILPIKFESGFKQFDESNVKMLILQLFWQPPIKHPGAASGRHRA
jgi:hypothetical protein